MNRNLLLYRINRTILISKSYSSRFPLLYSTTLINPLLLHTNRSFMDTSTNLFSTTTTTATASMQSSSASTDHTNPSSSILNLDDFNKIQQEMIQEDEKRESIIKRSRDLLKLSKQTIYETHRQGYTKAKDMITNAQTIAKELIDNIQDYPQLRYGSLSNALEEYTEAIIFYHYLHSHTLPRMQDIPYINKEEYLGGLMDFTGELNRYAVLRATARDITAVYHARDTLDIINSQLMLFDFRNGNLRRKYDGVKYTLRKLEQIIYELTLANSSMIVPKSGNLDEKILTSLSNTNNNEEGRENSTGDNPDTMMGPNDEPSKEGDGDYEGNTSSNRGGRRGGFGNNNHNKRPRQ